MVVIAVIVLLVAAIGALVEHQAKNYYVYAPGTAPVLSMSAACAGNEELVLPDGSPCARIEVPASLAHATSGKLFMVDVDVGQATAGEYLLGKLGLLDHLYKGDQLLPAAEYTGGASANQVQCQDVAQMSGAQQDAPVAALRRLGYAAKEVDRGASVTEVDPGTPAANAGLHCNDIITGINGKPVHTAQDLLNDIRALKPGESVSIIAPAGTERRQTGVSHRQGHLDDDAGGGGESGA